MAKKAPKMKPMDDSRPAKKMKKSKGKKGKNKKGEG